jgi:hypothetical protein
VTEFKNLIDMYVYAQGQSEVPPEMHKWSFMSLLAACMRDNVWYNKFKDTKLLPNLYVLFIGPSGVGKGSAINPVNKLAIADGMERINARRIKLTAAALVDVMSKGAPPGAEFVPSKIYLLTPELSNSIGAGQQAKDLIRMMTDLYDAGEFNPEEYTRTNKGHKIKRPVVNWNGGTTKEWLMSSLDMESVLSGFTARTICLQVDYDYILQHPMRRPVYPDDRDEVLAYISDRLVKLTQLRGPMRMTREAQEIEASWYEARKENYPDPEDPKFPVWRREHDMVLKVTMNYASASRHWHKRIMTSDDFSNAVSDVEAITSKIDTLINYASSTPQTAVIERCRNLLRQSGKLPHSALLRRLKVRSDEFDAVMATLRETREVEFGYNEDQNEFTYEWLESEHELGLEEVS